MAREGFLPPTEINVGFEPNGLTVADLNGDGIPDLLVSNPLGDVLVLIGNGDGTFQPVQNLDQQVSLAVYDQSGSTPAAFIFADQLTDQLVIQTVGGGTTVLGAASTPGSSPRARSTLADLNNNGILDLIVANSGSNNVLVYPGLGNGSFGQALNGGHGFFTGTNPVGNHCRRRERRRPARPDHRQRGIQRRFDPDQREGGRTASRSCRARASRSASGRSRPRSRTSPATACLTSSSPTAARTTCGFYRGIGNGFFNDQNPRSIPVGTEPDRGSSSGIS